MMANSQPQCDWRIFSATVMTDSTNEITSSGVLASPNNSKESFMFLESEVNLPGRAGRDEMRIERKYRWKRSRRRAIVWRLQAFVGDVDGPIDLLPPGCARTMSPLPMRRDEWKAVMNDSLSKDEYEALAQIVKLRHGERPSACVARNTKRLSGIKFISFGKDGHLTLTEKGEQTLFLKRCIDGLRAVSLDPLTRLEPDVATFLGKKGHVTVREDGGGFDITQRGQESLADIDAQSR
jgi:hypothetical protein